VSELRGGGGLSGIGWDGKRTETLNVDKNLKPQSALRFRGGHGERLLTAQGAKIAKPIVVV
jgi:hypothetical protein